MKKFAVLQSTTIEFFSFWKASIIFCGFEHILKLPLSSYIWNKSSEKYLPGMQVWLHVNVRRNFWKCQINLLFGNKNWFFSRRAYSRASIFSIDSHPTSCVKNTIQNDTLTCIIIFQLYLHFIILFNWFCCQISHYDWKLTLVI